MINVAILGFGVVGGGVAKLLCDNERETSSLGGDKINIKYILDLRDFPDSPFADKVIHNYDIIVNDPEVSVIIEVMGGSHPAYEFTVAALRRGKHVITSNKEVVSKFGDEFLALAKEHGVSYRFEAAVGGGIPVISPTINCVCQNKVSEIRGILNGTTNYILTKMFTFGENFESALGDAQKKGYAEANPDADILGIDAARKISILTALISGKLISPDDIHTEGITAIRKEDVKAAEKLSATIKLVGRGIVTESGRPMALVAPFIVKNGTPLSGVNDVYNAVEIIADPLGNVMFYGRGAGAGATASAVVGDLMQVMRMGIHCNAPEFVKYNDAVSFDEFVSEHYIACDKAYAKALGEAFPGAKMYEADGEVYAVTEAMKESSVAELIAKSDLKVNSRIRILA